MKKTVLFAALAGALTFSGAAYADLADYLANPGRQQAQSHQAPGCNAPLSGSGAGAFGFYSEQGANQKGGADGQQTGLNNSALCGNRNGEKNPS